MTYGDQRKWNEAEKLELQVMEIRKAKLGPDHPYILKACLWMADKEKLILD